MSVNTKKNNTGQTNKKKINTTVITGTQLEGYQEFHYQKPENYNKLMDFNTPSGKEVLLLKHNAVFYQTILNAIAAKNKADFFPLGPRTDESKKFQNEKIKFLLEAIINKKTLPSGAKVDYPLASISIFQASLQGARTVGSKVIGTARALMGKNTNSRYGGGKKVKKEKVKKDKVKKEKVKKEKVKKDKVKDKVKKDKVKKDKVKKTK